MRNLFFLVIACFFAVAFSFQGQAEDRLPRTQDEISLSFAPLVKSTAPAVVNIYTKRTVMHKVSPFLNDPFFDFFFGGRFSGPGLSRERIESTLGSGVIVGEERWVVSNAHVINDADEVTVVLSDGREFEAEKVLIDEPSDLAVLRIDSQGHDLPYVTLKPSEGLEVGDLVLAIGNPFGVGQTVTSGIVSAVGRSSLDVNDFNFFIQTDAAINPGNSGGPLVAMDGKVVGINTAIYSRDGGSLGIGFSIPSEMVATVLAAVESGQITESGVIRPWLGIGAQQVTSDIADSLGLEAVSGVLISEIHRSSPAGKAGLKTGDVVLTVNGKDVKTPPEMKFRTAMVPLGSHAEFRILRDGKTRDLKVKTMPPPDDPPRNVTSLEGSHPLSGATVANINPAVEVELGLQVDEGVVVMDVLRRTRAARVLVPGDIILEVNGDDIGDVKDLDKVLGKRNVTVWQFIISRNGRTQQIIIR